MLKAAPDDRVPLRPRPGTVLAVMSVDLFLACLDSLAVNNALPRVATDLGVGISRLQWVTASYTLVVAAFLLSGSLLGRRLGGTNAFLAGVALFTAGSMAGALAPSWGMLVAGRATQGLGAALMLPASTAVLRTVFPDEDSRAKASGVRGAVAGLGFALGPVVGGTLVDWFGWRSVLWINVPAGVATLVVGLWVLPRLPGVPVRWDPFGQLLAASGLAGLIYGLVQGPGDGWQSARVLGALCVAVAALPAFVLVESRVREPMLDLTVFKDRVFATAALACCATSAALGAALFFLSLYLQEILRWSPGKAGLAFLVGSGFIVVSAPLAGLVCARRGPSGPLLAGAALCPPALAGLSLYGLDADFGDLWWVFLTIGVCAGLTYVPVAVIASRRVAVQRAGMMSAVVDTVEECGAVIGIAALGAVFSSRLSGALYDRAAQAGLPPSDARHLVHVVLTGDPAHGLGGDAGVSPLVRTWITESFVDGMHLALRCGAVAYGVVLLVLLSTRRLTAEA